VLGIGFKDNVKARFLRADGSYRRAEPRKGEKKRRSQMEFIALASADEPARSVNGRGKYPRVTLLSRPESAGPRPRKTRLKKS